MSGEKTIGSQSESHLDALLKPYQKRIEDKIREELSVFDKRGRLFEACEYALLNGGKRFRPALVYMMAEALGCPWDVSQAALAVEYFHTASLVADDLPCMDDDDERRNKPSVHKVFGEAVALLASYALIAAGYGAIAACTKEMSGYFADDSCADPHLAGILALENAAFNTGLEGATGGQFLDIFPYNLSLEALREVIHKKTASLFEISFVFGWLFGGGDPKMMPLVKAAAAHFGMAFQIADDLGDVEQDRINGRQVNIAAVLGSDPALQIFLAEMNGFRQALETLNLPNSKELTGVADILEAYAAQEAKK